MAVIAVGAALPCGKAMEGTSAGSGILSAITLLYNTVDGDLA